MSAFHSSCQIFLLCRLFNYSKQVIVQITHTVKAGVRCDFFLHSPQTSSGLFLIEGVLLRRVFKACQQRSASALITSVSAQRSFVFRWLALRLHASSANTHQMNTCMHTLTYMNSTDWKQCWLDQTWVRVRWFKDDVTRCRLVEFEKILVVHMSCSLDFLLMEPLILLYNMENKPGSCV